MTALHQSQIADHSPNGTGRYHNCLRVTTSCITFGFGCVKGREQTIHKRIDSLQITSHAKRRPSYRRLHSI
jgi:hypothetical protein